MDDVHALCRLGLMIDDLFHDELVFDAIKEEVEYLRALVKEEMESAMPLGEVPVLVETGIGNNWEEAH